MTSCMETFPSGDIIDVKPIWSGKLHTNYLIKIEEDYKMMTNCFLDKQNLEKVVRTYYPGLSIEFFPIQTNTPNLIQLMTHSNSFLKTNEISPDELQNKLRQWDEVMGYFNKYSESKITELFKQTAEKIFEEKKRAIDIRIGDNTRYPVSNAKLHNLANGDFNANANANANANIDGFKDKSLMPKISLDNFFEATGNYVNSKEISRIDGPYF